VFDVRILLDASPQRVVDELELTDHIIGTLTQADLDVGSQLLRDLAFAARSRNVLLRELHPRHRIRHPAPRTTMCTSSLLYSLVQ